MCLNALKVEQTRDMESSVPDSESINESGDSVASFEDDFALYASRCESSDDIMAYADEPLADEEWLKKYEAENEKNKRLEQEFQARLLTRRCSSSGVLMSFRKSFRGSTVYCFFRQQA